MDKIFFKIFGEQIFENSLSQHSFEDLQKLYPEQIGRINFWLDEKLKEIEWKNENSDLDAIAPRIGPDKVILEVSDINAIKVCSDMLTVQSLGTFTTVKANVCVYAGRFMYEVQLQSKGVMQIGWCSNKCSFTSDTGVGDTKFSYGFDGSKQQIWHVHTTKYGEKWTTGDIIGVCLDMDTERIEYYRNGESLGTAFSSIEKGPGIALFPAVSLAYNEGLKANFGNLPFRHPISTYQPLQTKPRDNLEKAELLLGYIVNLANILSRPKYRREKLDKKALKEGKTCSKRTIYMLISLALVEKFVPILIDPYVIEEKFLLYVMNLCVLRSEADKDSVILPGSMESTLGTLLSLLWSYMEDEDSKFIFKKLLNIILSKYSQTAKDMDFELQRKMIVILTCICNHPQTRKFYIEHKFFKKNCLPLFLYLRPPEYATMTNLLPDEWVWTKGIGGPIDQYVIACDKLKKSVETLYGLQRNLMKVLLCNDDASETSPSSRKIFMSKFRKYVMDNSMEQRNMPSPIESPIALSFLCIMVDVTRNLFETELPDSDIAVDPRYFFDGSFRYQHFDRVGGVISHLRKVHHNDIIAYLGESPSGRTTHADDSDMVRVDTNDVYSAMFLISGNLNTISIVGRAQNLANERNQIDIISPGHINVEISLNELLDLTILYYYAVGHKHIVKMVAIRDEIGSLNDVLLETKKYRNDVEQNIKNLGDSTDDKASEIHRNILTELQDKYTKREQVFSKRSIELSRKQAWYRSVALGDYRKQILIWLLNKTLKTLQKCSDLGPLFAFVPEVYVNILPILLDTMLDFSFHDIRTQFEISDGSNVVQQAAEFLGTHAADSRIVLASCKDSLLQALGTLTCHEIGIKALEKSSSTGQISLISALLRPYENRAWGQSNWLLLRFWLGDGYAYKDSRPPIIWQGGNKVFSLGLQRSRAKNETHTGLLHHIAPAYPSKHFQRLIGKHLTEDEPFATAFLNSVLSQLNWAFSEFVLLLQEIQNTSHRQEGQQIVFEPRQLKICSMCFELTVSLMRSLEMIIRVAPNIFHDSARPNSDLILNRVCQLISQVLSRVTVPPGCFQYVIDMCLPDLSTVSHFAIISAALGILLSLLKEEMESTVKPDKISRVTRSLLTDPSFQIANLEYALGDVQTKITQQGGTVPRGNFDPKTRAHIDPLTNDVRVPIPSSSKQIRTDQPILMFSIRDYPSHVTCAEVFQVRKLIDMLLVKQTLLSDITLPSEDSLCPICCAKPISVSFFPCKHQSCRNCILQHLMTSQACFYCKTIIKDVLNTEGAVVFTNANYIPIPNGS